MSPGILLGLLVTQIFNVPLWVCFIFARKYRMYGIKTDKVTSNVFGVIAVGYLLITAYFLIIKP